MFWLTYNTSHEKIGIEVKTSCTPSEPNAPYDVLTIGDVTIFPSRSQLFELSQKLNDYLFNAGPTEYLVKPEETTDDLI